MHDAALDLRIRKHTPDSLRKSFQSIHTGNQNILNPAIMKLAIAIGIDSGVVAKAIRLTLLSPKIIHKLILGDINLSMMTLRRSFPMVWSQQEKLFIK